MQQVLVQANHAPGFQFGNFSTTRAQNGQERTDVPDLTCNVGMQRGRLALQHRHRHLKHHHLHLKLQGEGNTQSFHVKLVRFSCLVQHADQQKQLAGLRFQDTAAPL
jgi:hypothetical protein